MDRIGVRELRQHASRYLDRVQAGETVEVTNRGTVVALLSPPGPARGDRDRLIAAGRLLPAASPLTAPKRLRTSRASGTVLDDLRAER